MKYLFLNNENIDFCLPPYLRINMTIWLKKNKYQILTYHVNNTYAKLAPDSIPNKKIKEIMHYMGGHRPSPFWVRLSWNTKLYANITHLVQYESGTLVQVRM